VIAIPLAAALVYLALRGVDWRAVRMTLARTNAAYLAVAVAISCVSLLVRSLRWRILLNAEGHAGVAAVFWATAAGYLGNNFLPARAGELVRSAMISLRSGLSKTYALTTTLTERVMDAIALISISSLVLATMPGKPAWLASASRPVAAIGLAGAIAIVVLPFSGGFLKKLLGRFPMPSKLRDRLLGIAGQVLLGVRSLHGLARLGGFVSLTAVVWTCDATGSIILARALGLSLSFPVALLLIAGLGLASALPSTPGYIGIYQFVAVSILPPFGFSRSDALAYILMLQAFGYLVITALGLIGLWQYRSARRERGE
jgi:hypothetical protein